MARKLLRCLALALGVLALGAVPASAQRSFVYVSNSQSISQYSIEADGRLTPLSPPAFQTPGFLSVGLAATPDGRSVYAASDGVLQLDVNPVTGQLSPKSPSTVAVPDAWTITVAPNGRDAYVVGIGVGLISQLTVDPASGRLVSKSPPAVTAGGSDAFPFELAVSPDGRNAYVATFNLGVLHYSVDTASGTLTPASPFSVPAGDTSEGVAVTPDGRSVYVSDINSGTISQYDVDPGSGQLAPKSPPTVPTGVGPTNGLVVTPDGRHAYVYNSGVGGGTLPGETVSQYDIDPATGALTPKTPPFVVAGPGSTASDAAISPDGRSLYVVNSFEVRQYSIDPSSGALSPKNPATLPTGGDSNGIAIATPQRALPTTKDQCKNGGWQTFGVFRNQGDCVSFVMTGGKNPPGA
jgi:6-phosphogluconolactonase (cycloisomerase 2 family)